jgi:hypothetical protein
MKTFVISYDLHKLGQRYAALKKLIESQYGGSWHCLESLYIVKSTSTPGQIAQSLSPALDANDELLVYEVVPGAWASYGFSGPCLTWLQNNG